MLGEGQTGAKEVVVLYEDESLALGFGRAEELAKRVIEAALRVRADETREVD